MFIQTLKRSIISILKNGTSPHKLALTCAIGLYIALSPFPGLHTLMLLAAYRFFQLNLPLLFIVVSVSNPWTMIPLYGLGYAAGYWLVHSLLGFTPIWHFDYAAWFSYFNLTLPFSGDFCIVSFLVGGNVLGIIAALISYPLIKRLSQKIHQPTPIHQSELNLTTPPVQPQKGPFLQP